MILILWMSGRGRKCQRALPSPRGSGPVRAARQRACEHGLWPRAGLDGENRVASCEGHRHPPLLGGKMPGPDLDSRTTSMGRSLETRGDNEAMHRLT